MNYLYSWYENITKENLQLLYNEYIETNLKQLVKNNFLTIKFVSSNSNFITMLVRNILKNPHVADGLESLYKSYQQKGFYFPCILAEVKDGYKILGGTHRIWAIKNFSNNITSFLSIIIDESIGESRFNTTEFGEYYTMGMGTTSLIYDDTTISKLVQISGVNLDIIKTKNTYNAVSATDKFSTNIGKLLYNYMDTIILNPIINNENKFLTWAKEIKN